MSDNGWRFFVRCALLEAGNQRDWRDYCGLLDGWIPEENINEGKPHYIDHPFIEILRGGGAMRKMGEIAIFFGRADPARTALIKIGGAGKVVKPHGIEQKVAKRAK